MRCVSKKCVCAVRACMARLFSFLADHIALFLLMVEEGMMIGANGWSEDYDKPLGKPLGPATNITGNSGSTTTGLERSFESGTKVTFDLESGTGHIAWAAT